jgi:hypothetical protein
MPNWTSCAACRKTPASSWSTWKRASARTGIANLRVEYNKVHGFYIEVTNGQADKVPDDYRRRQTLKNAERYITPELKAFEDKALSAQDRALAREKMLYDQLGDLAPFIGTLQAIAGAGAAGHADRPHRPRAAPQLVRAGAGGDAVHQHQGRPPPGGGEPDRALHRQRLPLRRRTPPAADHRPEHGR